MVSRSVDGQFAEGLARRFVRRSFGLVDGDSLLAGERQQDIAKLLLNDAVLELLCTCNHAQYTTITAAAATFGVCLTRLFSTDHAPKVSKNRWGLQMRIFLQAGRMPFVSPISK